MWRTVMSNNTEVIIPAKIIINRRLSGLFFVLLIFPFIAISINWLSLQFSKWVNSILSISESFQWIVFLFVYLTSLLLFAVFLFFIFLIFSSFKTDFFSLLKSNDNKVYVFNTFKPCIGLLLIFFGFLPVYIMMLKEILPFFQTDIDLLSRIFDSATYSAHLREKGSYLNTLLIAFSYATLNSYWICLFSVSIAALAGFISASLEVLRESKRYKWLYYSINLIIKPYIQIVESIPAIILICIILPVITILLYKLGTINTGYLCYFVGIVIGMSCAPLTFRLVENQIYINKNKDFVKNAKYHGVKWSRIIWQHIIWKNAFPKIVNELIFIWGFTFLVETGLCILYSRGNISLPIIGNIHFSLGNILTTEDTRTILISFLNTGQFTNSLELVKLLLPFIITLLIISGLFIIKAGFDEAMIDRQLEFIKIEELIGYDLLIHNYLNKSTNCLNCNL